ncbi:unnamed protein product [Ectocarpus sp. 6 AP-2014]
MKLGQPFTGAEIVLARGANPVATSILLSDFRNRRTRSARTRWACGKWQARAGDTDVKASSAEARISPWHTALWVVPVCISRIFFLKRCQVDVVTSCHAAQLPLRLLPLLLRLPLLLLPVTLFAAQHVRSCRCQLHGQQYNNVWCVQHDGSCIARAPHSRTLVRPTLVCGVRVVLAIAAAAAAAAARQIIQGYSRSGFFPRSGAVRSGLNRSAPLREVFP